MCRKAKGSLRRDGVRRGCLALSCNAWRCFATPCVCLAAGVTLPCMPRNCHQGRATWPVSEVLGNVLGVQGVSCRQGGAVVGELAKNASRGLSLEDRCGD